MRYEVLGDDGILPDVLDPDVMYGQVFNPSLGPWAVHFLCPCGDPNCMINIPIEPGCSASNPKWTMSLNGDKPTLNPSLQQKGGCKNHFFVRDGKIEIC